MRMNSMFACVTFATLAALATGVNAFTVIVPNDPGTGPAGVTVTVTGTFASAQTITFNASGPAFLQNTCGPQCNTGAPQYGVNAAGVVTAAGQGPSQGVGSALFDSVDGYEYGALLVSLNGGAFQQVFATNAADGLGSSAPTARLTFSGTLGSVFGNFGTVTNPTLTAKVDDSEYNDNSGFFTLTGFTTVPEPANWTLMLVGFFVVGCSVRRKAGAYRPTQAKLNLSKNRHGLLG